jgi:hypothetical protein
MICIKCKQRYGTSISADYYSDERNHCGCGEKNRNFVKIRRPVGYDERLTHGELVHRVFIEEETLERVNILKPK